MNPEQTTTPQPNNGNLDPSIDPNVLVEQEGEDKGRIAAAETVPGTIIESDDPDKIGTPHDTITGIPVIGAEAHDRNRTLDRSVAPQSEIDSGVSDAFADWAGNTAMATEVGNRAEALLPTDATDEERRKAYVEAASNFREQMSPKSISEDVIKAEFGDSVDTTQEHTDESQIREEASKLVPDIASDKLRDQMINDAVERHNTVGAPAATTTEIPTPGGPIAPMHLMEKDRNTEPQSGSFDHAHEENLGDIMDQEGQETEG